MQSVPPSYMAYDRTIVVFSPEGRLLQVEYARQAVKRGLTAIGLVARDSVILGATKTSIPLSVENTFKKVFEIDNHVGLVGSGILADARDLVDIARVKAQVHQITYGEPISIHSVAKYIANYKHMATQYAGLRPFGIGLLIGGVDTTGPNLFETDPSGTLLQWKAQSIGRGAEKAKKVLKNEYKDSMPLKDAVNLVLKALKAGEKDVKKENIELAIITPKEFRMMHGSDIKEK
ncbi:MAG: archaeal proteasome endopeptidase complex subunit alpha [Candidatus Aenigmarchaeota archaeon]|nr:archaeal proteasome endopeptidase complex subunit alpha [Candidatus Aenigmarchaeota archaeon]